MRWRLPKSNKEIWCSDSKYLIDWTKAAPSKGAQVVKVFLQANYSKHIIYEEYFLPKTKLRVDFLVPGKKMAIEFDGIQHSNFNKHFHRNRIGYLNSIGRDTKKEEYLEWNGYRVVRITEDDLDKLSVEWLRDNWGII